MPTETAHPIHLATPVLILLGATLMAAAIAVPSAAFWLQVAAGGALAVGMALLAMRFAPPGLGFPVGAAALAATLGLLAWALPEHRDWAWGIAALAGLFVVRSFVPCCSCVGGVCSTRPRETVPGFRFPPGH